MAHRPARDAQEALDEAQDLVFEAWDSATSKRCVALAKKALTISPLCADAYVLLAEHATTGSEEELDLWQRGVDAGKAALGADFDGFVGGFWGFLETRPYMRARLGLACVQWARGARDEAIDHLRAMLDLNPDDNQGVRYILASWLIEEERDADLRTLLARYSDDDMANWTWTTVLANFRGEGDTEESRRLLAKAMAGNPHVLAYLSGERKLPRSLPPFYSSGEDSEAVHYAEDFRAGWVATPGALEWLTAHQPERKSLRRRASRKVKSA
ncbi:hypothetical protein [Beijerinckia indica]|uniref:Tetratricopeptide TPR_2 n=1 Tax=Beijerinckia indica subsp. indica (strain ATCC 9039 / DSM 1715 / NCIMB 8712) TaxID=395963 RepID=B2IJT3_BEII9|nr:hypothetical protein [Beijerinckia indica]ACB96308.1 tetratricopeptide TPR_2 [Beijerinckia indica subsp. indica ATCC 9039]